MSQLAAMESQPNQHLALFARFPYPGKCKTRLIPRLGAEGACSFAYASQLDILHLFASMPFCHKTLSYTPEASRSDVEHFLHRESLSSSWDIHAQSNTPVLGDRLIAAMEFLRKRKSTTLLESTPVASGSVTFMAMDCFDLTIPLLQRSMSFVSSSPKRAYMVPACDGGYVLLTVPLDCDATQIFTQVPWSCDRTGNVQLERLTQAGLECAVGEALPDVDEPDDLDALWETRQKKRDSYPRVFAYLETIMAEQR